MYSNELVCDILEFIDKGTRKSIEFSYIEEKGYKIVESYTPRLKYLDAVDNAYFKEWLWKN